MIPFKKWFESIMDVYYRLKQKYYFNSWAYFNLYYKHTKKHKEEMRKITEHVLKVRKKAIGW